MIQIQSEKPLESKIKFAADSIRNIPVSRASFQLSDRSAFKDAVALAVSWVARTTGSELPSSARDGQSFDVDSPEAIASALRLDDEQGSIWASKVIFRGDPAAPRQWVTDLFVEQQPGSFARFGAQLTCRCGMDDPGFEHSRPRIVKDVLKGLAAEADGEALSNTIDQIGFNDLGNLLSLLYNPHRRLPVVLVSTDDDANAQVDLAKLANRLSGTAHLRSIPIEPSFELTRLVGKRMSTFNGAVRAYMPGLEQGSEDPFRHPLWMAPRVGRNYQLLNEIAARILPLGFRDADGDARFWRIGLLRQATSRAEANRQTGSEKAQLSAEVEALRAETEASQETSQAAEALMYEAAAKLENEQAEVARLQEDNYALRQRIKGITFSSQGE